MADQEDGVPRFKRFLVAVDGSPNSTKAVKVALTLAREHGGELLAIYVVQPPAYTSPEYSTLVPMLTKASEEHGKEVLGQVEAMGKAEGVVVATRLDVGPVRERLLEVIAEYSPDLLVVGSRGLTGVKRVLLGSVSEAMVRYGGCSVLVVR